jgi:hypothetical protein
MRYSFTLNSLLRRPNDFYNSIKALWSQTRHIFPNISADELINNAKKERNDILKFITN